MLTLTHLRLLNWKCFQGETVLDLEPKAYAITAVKDGDADSSNWAGKTSLLEAVDFALTGRRPRDARLKSDWITRGEGQGEVDLTFSSGARVVRNMSRKGSERLAYYPPGDPEHGATQEDAQTAIDELLGLSRDDAPTWSFRQGEMAELLRMDPAPRLEMFSAWFRLGTLEECQGVAVGVLGEMAKRAEAARASLAAANAATETALARVGLSAEALGETLKKAESDVEEARSALEAERARDAEGREKRDLISKAARYDELVKEGTSLAERLKEHLDVGLLRSGRETIMKRREELRRVEDAAAGRHRQLVQVAAGNFDGQCPVAGVPCPAKAFVSESVQRNRSQEEDARKALREAQSESGKVTGQIAAADQRIRELEVDDRRLRELRIQARELKPARDRWAELADVANRGTVVAAENALRDAEATLSRLRQTWDFCQDSAARALEAATEVKALEGASEIPAAAALVFERARRKIAEDVLVEIEGHANDLLALVGADLEVAVTWGRDGTGLADACGGCGASFPASRKVRACARCGAERGPKVVEKLDIEPSRRSGCADDFGGIAVALGSSRWLREDRGSAWGTALLDEPTSQMDVAHVRQFAAKLPELLLASGFQQALVVSHHRGALASMPGRILVESSGGKSTARVVV